MVRKVKNVKTSDDYNIGSSVDHHIETVYNTETTDDGQYYENAPSEIKSMNKEEIENYINNWYKSEMDDIMRGIPFYVIEERANQSIDYMINDDIDNCPLVKTYATVRGVEYSDAAETFMSDKRDINMKMISLEKIVWYYANVLDLAETDEDYVDILDDFRSKHVNNGY